MENGDSPLYGAKEQFFCRLGIRGEKEEGRERARGEGRKGGERRGEERVKEKRVGREGGKRKTKGREKNTPTGVEPVGVFLLF